MAEIAESASESRLFCNIRDLKLVTMWVQIWAVTCTILTALTETAWKDMIVQCKPRVRILYPFQGFRQFQPFPPSFPYPDV